MASAARSVVLAQALHTAREPVRLFLESAGNGPLATAAAETVKAAAAAFPRAHGAVQSIAAAGGGVGGEPEGGGVATLSGRVAEGGYGEGGGGAMTMKEQFAVGERDRGRTVKGGGSDDLGSAEAEAGADAIAQASGGAGAAAAEEVLAMEREDAAERAAACRKVVGEWWERQQAAVEDGLQDREKEASDRR